MKFAFVQIARSRMNAKFVTSAIPALENTQKVNALMVGLNQIIDIWRCKMPKRTPDNCKYINCHGEPGRDSNGKCMGFSLAGDDEPIEVCKRCVYCTAHEEDFR